MKWECTCATCPMFEPLKKPENAPADLNPGMCFGSPGNVQLVPIPPQVGKKQIIETPEQANMQRLDFGPHTFERVVDSSRIACSIHPEWHYRVLAETATKLQADAATAFLLAVAPEGNS